MAPEISQVNFRMPTALKERLEQQAKANGRSLTAEIITRLDASLHQPAMGSLFGMGADPTEDARDLVRKVDELIEKADRLLSGNEK